MKPFAIYSNEGVGRCPDNPRAAPALIVGDAPKLHRPPCQALVAGEAMRRGAHCEPPTTTVAKCNGMVRADSDRKLTDPAAASSASQVGLSVR